MGTFRHTGPAPSSAEQAVARAVALVTTKTGQYALGTGDYKPQGDDVPWTQRSDGLVGSDCAGFAICWCYMLPRHRQGFAPGRMPTAYADQLDIDDDINVNSAIEDAFTQRELFRLVEDGEQPLPGDLVCYPSIRITGADGQRHDFVGHVAIVTGVDRYAALAGARRWDLLDVAQCHGPDRFSPGAVFTDGSLFAHHDAVWPKPAHRCFLLRVVQ